MKFFSQKKICVLVLLPNQTSQNAPPVANAYAAACKLPDAGDWAFWANGCLGKETAPTPASSRASPPPSPHTSAAPSAGDSSGRPPPRPLPPRDQRFPRYHSSDRSYPAAVGSLFFDGPS